MVTTTGLPWDMHRHPLVVVALSAAAGTAWGRWAEVNLSAAWIATATALGCWLVARSMGCRRLSSLAIVLAIAVQFAYWTSFRWNYFRDDDIGLRATERSTPVVLEATLLTKPRTVRVRDLWAPGLEEFSDCTIAVSAVRDGRTWRSASGQGRLVIAGSLQGVWDAGDVVRIYGKLSRFAAPANPGEKTRQGYFRQRRQLFQVRVSGEASVRLLRPAPWWSVRRNTERLRHGACQLLERYVAQEWFPLAAALLLGARHHLDYQTLEPFLQTGTVHVLAISGLHLGMLIYGVFLLLRLGLLRRKVVLWSTILLVCFYAILTSGQPPVVRAALLTVGVSVARLIGRPYFTWNLWGAGALVVLLYNPLQLFDVGVQLSFLAVATLISAPPVPFVHRRTDPLTRWLEESLPWWYRVGRGCVLTGVTTCWLGLMVWLVTLPLVVYCFHRASPVAVLVNPILWLPIAAGLLTGFGVLFFGCWCPPAAWLCGMLCTWCLKGAYGAVLWAEQLTGAHVWIAAPPGVWVAAFYVVWFLWITSARPWRLWLGCGCWATCLTALSLPVVMPYFAPRDPNTLRITFFAVGHGTCVVVELPCGKTLLYDAGRFGSPRPVVQYVSDTAWTRGISVFDLVVLSHADSDHFNALPGLLERIPVRDVAVPAPISESPSPLVQQLANFLDERKLSVRLLARGEVLRFPDTVTIDVLHPPVGFRGETDNAQSIVLRVCYAGRTIVLAGDLEGSGMDRLLATPPFAIDVLMSPHHASANSNHLAWARWASARHVIICDSGPLPEATEHAYRQVGSYIWYTDHCGAVELTVDRHGAMVLRGFKSRTSFHDRPASRQELLRNP